METSEKTKGTEVLETPLDSSKDNSFDPDKVTFTKSIMTIVVLLYFLGAILGGALVVVSALVDVKLGGAIDTQMFIAYVTYIGGPTATAIGFYAWKSKAENILKIQNSNQLSQKISTAFMPEYTSEEVNIFDDEDKFDLNDVNTKG